MVDDKKQQSVVTLSFNEADLPRPSDNDHTLPRKLQFMQATSELSARVMEDSLESSVEEGVDISLSSSQNSRPGQDLMSQHLKQMKNKLPPTNLKWSGESSAFFRPVVAGDVQDGTEEEGNWQTDEEKSQNLVRPTIFLNDSEVKLSPQSPPGSEDVNIKVPTPVNNSKL